MYESYYGFTEKPFSLTPDPKYLYRSESHASAFELLQYAIRRREGFVVVTGDIGTGKTTLCRALLEQIDRTTFTALVLNPFLSEQDLLKRILLDFGVISRDDLKAGRLAGVSKQELIDALSDFLLGLVPLNASAVLIIDEAQNLPLAVLEQVRILSNLETAKEKLLQIILVGQLELQTLLRSPELRQLDQRVSIRYELQPLDRDATGAYVAHRLAVAGGSAAVAFTTKALDGVHRLSGGIPRVINLICDRALLAGYAERTSRITPALVTHAAKSLEVQGSNVRRWPALLRRAAVWAGAAGVVLASFVVPGSRAFLRERFTAAASPLRPSAINTAAWHPSGQAIDRRLPADASLTILVGTYPDTGTEADGAVRTITDSLEHSGFRVYYGDSDLGARGRWRRVLAGAYTNEKDATDDAERLRREIPAAEPRIVDAVVVTSADPDDFAAQRAGIE